MGSYLEVTTSQELKQVLASDSAQLLFLYDPYCPTNWHARAELDELAADVSIVDVAQHPQLGTEIQSATGVKHESPQVLILRHGRVAWHASHGAIRASTLRRLLGRAA
jgi:bacillithiol system protein YtxJ